MKKFINRQDAGRALAESLQSFKNNPNTIVLALPRGGVPVAYEIAEALSLPLDIFIVRKLGVPQHEELAMGAIASGETVVFNKDVIHSCQISQTEIDNVIKQEKEELLRREKTYRGNHLFPDLANQTIILVDDGIATGATMRVAIKALRQYQPKRIVVAVPVAEVTIYKEIQSLVEEIICPLTPSHLSAVGAWYDDFAQTTDEEVFNLLRIII